MYRHNKANGERAWWKRSWAPQARSRADGNNYVAIGSCLL